MPGRLLYKQIGVYSRKTMMQLTVDCYNKVMEFSISLSLVFATLIGLIAGLVLGVFFTRSKETADDGIDNAELMSTNRVLEERLSNQQSQYEAQLKLLQDAKQSLSQEFENLANRILDEKTLKFTEQNKNNLKEILSPFDAKIQEFKGAEPGRQCGNRRI